jgi:hypothetical protein
MRVYELAYAGAMGRGGRLFGPLFDALTGKRSSEPARIAPVTSFDHVNPHGDPLAIDLSAINVDEVIATIADHNADSSTRQKAFAVVVEVLAPKSLDEWAWDDTDRRIVAELLRVTRRESAKEWPLQYDAGEALGFAWVWGRCFDRDAYLDMSTAAQKGARKVIGEADLDWNTSLSSDEE